MKKLYNVTEKKKRENYLRVTQILYPFSGMDKIDADVLAKAANRGTLVHKICEGIILGLGEIGVDEEVAGYIQSFKQWWENGIDVIKMEERFWDDDNEFTGQVDLIINTPDGLAVVDFKTSYKESKTWPVQGAAYAYLAKQSGYDIKKIYFLHLKKTGKPAKIYEYAVDDSLFFSIFRTFQHFFQG